MPVTPATSGPMRWPTGVCPADGLACVRRVTAKKPWLELVPAAGGHRWYIATDMDGALPIQAWSL
jgi:hypothetical protein